MQYVQYDVPIFDPFKHRGDNYYHPGNLASTHLMQIQFIYEDISALFSIFNKIKDNYQQNLISKYIIIEWLSLDSFICNFSQQIIRKKLEYPPDDKEISKVKELYKDYKNVRKKYYQKLKTIRDKISAHRDPISFLHIAKLWDDIDIREIASIAKSIPPFFNYVKDLNIYIWKKTESTTQGEIKAFIIPLRYNEIKDSV
jgi:hypothetical protein